MSWLKDILDENRRVVDSWPAWKKGAAMTRNEELAKRAKETTEQLLDEGVCLSDGECGITDRVILQALQQVEREVWGEVIQQIDYRHTTVTMEQSTLKEWCMARYKELG